MLRCLLMGALLCGSACGSSPSEPGGAPKVGQGEGKVARAASAPEGNKKKKKKKGKAAPAQGEAAPAAEAPPRQAAAQPKVRAPAPPLAESTARELLSTWLSAQHARKFEDYAALYAEGFVGVKRSGPRVVRFDREGWLKDRRKMFRKPMKVSAEDVAIETTERTAVLTFEQKWSSRRYADQGPKRIVAVAGEDGLRIVSEVMLASTLRETAAGRPPLPPTDFMFALHADGPYLVLSLAAEPTWASGAPELAGEDSPLAATRAIELERLPDELKHLAGSPVQLYSSGGVACSGSLGEPRLMRRVIPHVEMQKEWFGEPPGSASGAANEAMAEPAGPPPLAPAAIAQAVWGLGSEQTLLVAGLAETTGDCRDALWGRAADNKREAKIFTGTTAGADEAERVTADVRGLPAYHREQATFVAETGAKRDQPWELFEGAEPELRSWRTQDRSFYSFYARAGAGCGGFAGGIWALYEVMGEELWHLTEPRKPGALRPIAIFDADGDGLIEVLVAPGDYAPREGTVEAGRLLRQRPDKGFDAVASIEVPYFDCGC